MKTISSGHELSSSRSTLTSSPSGSNAKENETLMKPLREFDLAVKTADPGGLLPGVTTLPRRTVSATTKSMSTTADEAELFDPTNGSTSKAYEGGLDDADENGLVSLRGVNFRWSLAGEGDEYAKTFQDLANAHKLKKGKTKVGRQKRGRTRGVAWGPSFRTSQTCGYCRVVLLVISIHIFDSVRLIPFHSFWVHDNRLSNQYFLDRKAWQCIRFLRESKRNVPSYLVSDYKMVTQSRCSKLFSRSFCP